MVAHVCLPPVVKTEIAPGQKQESDWPWMRAESIPLSKLPFLKHWIAFFYLETRKKHFILRGSIKDLNPNGCVFY